jgi:uroporphyrinogen-III decarboxylase
MTSRERIKRTLDFKIPDRVGIYDNIAGEFPEFDLKLFDLDKFDPKQYEEAKEKGLYLVASFSCPFQKMTFDLGLEEALLLIAKEPSQAKKRFAENEQHVLAVAEKRRQDGFVFDGAWMWSDLAYKKATYFSVETYKKLLHEFHFGIGGYFKGLGMPLILHSDGNCASFIPLFLDAGVRALNPLETDCGFGDAEFVKKEYGKDLVLFGNMPVIVLEKSKKEIEEVFKKRLEILKTGGGYIYHGDKPIPETVSLENYKFALGIIKKYGGY